MHNSQLTMDYFVSILYYFVFFYNQRVHNKKSALFQNALPGFSWEIQKKFGCPPPLP